MQCAELVALVSYLAALSFIRTRLCRDVQLNSNSNMKLTYKHQKKNPKSWSDTFHLEQWSMSRLSWESDGAISTAWTYFWLGAKYRVADITWVAVGTKCCTLNLKMGILLHEKKVRNSNCALVCIYRSVYVCVTCICGVYPDAKAGKVQVAWIVQRQAGVVGVFQSVLKLHLHRQTPTRAANHIRLLSAEETQWELTKPRRCLILSNSCGKRSE